MASDRQELLDHYAATSRGFSDAVERLRHLNTDVEAFIRALAEVGTAHRARERSRIKLDKLKCVTRPEESARRYGSLWMKRLGAGRLRHSSREKARTGLTAAGQLTTSGHSSRALSGPNPSLQPIPSNRLNK